ncbi:hypothetical protein EV182_005690 [Spiromyces aspiralis]|uniref:Uncharacterized protein n=1 Tax=Spiromyces aspiralis TaxID=68401 RepID=A0ACC1HA95_9FUNG|nr:hypothetical protein EV182_005690 [Spiromyces aspiralis]
MYQVISSAIVNVPPPKGVIKLTHLGSLKSYRLDNNTKEYLDKTFDRDVDGRKLGLFSKKLLRRRNFATFVENNNFLHVELHAEAKKVAVYTTTSYELQIPTLNIRQPGLEEHSDELSPSSSLSSSLFQISTAGHNVDVDSSLESPSSEDSGGITILRRSKAEGDEETGEILADDATLKAIDESRPANKLDSTHN